MTGHTKCPWRFTTSYDGCINVWADKQSVAIIYSSGDKVANARRIVACVNACEGIPTDLIEKHGVTRTGTARIIAELSAQRDDLLAAVKANHEWHKNYDDHGGYPESELCQQNEAAISTQAEGETA